MKKVALIGSPALHKNYQAALEKASCKAVIFPDSSYIKKHPESFDGLLLPGGADVFSSLSAYAPFFKAPPADSAICDTFVSSSSGCHNYYDDCVSSLGNVSTEPLLDLEQLTALHLFCKQKKPVFGICKGMQLINLYFHGTIREVANRRLHQKNAKDVLHPADNLPGSFLHALFGAHMFINSNHHQCIDIPGKNLQIIQYAPDKTAEAVVHLSAPVFGTQWHPERMPKLPRQDAALLFQYFVSLL